MIFLLSFSWRVRRLDYELLQVRFAHESVAVHRRQKSIGKGDTRERAGIMFQIFANARLNHGFITNRISCYHTVGHFERNRGEHMVLQVLSYSWIVYDDRDLDFFPEYVRHRHQTFLTRVVSAMRQLLG